MAKQSSGLPEAVEQALAQALGVIYRQLSEVQASYQDAAHALKSARGGGAEQFTVLLPSLVQMQAASAALAASIEFLLRFAGSSARWRSVPSLAASMTAAETAVEVGAVEEVIARAAQGPQPVQQPAPVAPPPRVPTAPSMAPPPVVASPPAPAPVAAAPPVVPAAPAVAPHPVAAPAPAPAPAAVGVATPAGLMDVNSLPDDLQRLHKKAKRFSKVTVQELFMYKKDEVVKGRKTKDLYERFKEEIDKSKALYDKRFEKIVSHNIDYLYDELLRVLAENDASALGKYPYAAVVQG